MDAESLRAAAKRLFDERQSSYYVPGWDRAGFLRRVRRLAGQTSRMTVGAGDETMAMMYLDIIATREGIELKFKEDK